jgi:hypothetical protein
MPDFDEKPDLGDVKVPPKVENQKPLDALLALLETWGGMPAEKAILHIDPENLTDLDAVVQQIVEGASKDQEEAQTLKETLEAAKKKKSDTAGVKKAEAEIQKRLDEQAATAVTKSKEIKEKLGKDEDKKEGEKEKEAPGVEPFDAFTTDREWGKEFEKIGETAIGKKLESNEAAEKGSQKSDEQRAKALWDLLSKVADSTEPLATEHDKSVGELLES